MRKFFKTLYFFYRDNNFSIKMVLFAVTAFCHSIQRSNLNTLFAKRTLKHAEELRQSAQTLIEQKNQLCSAIKIAMAEQTHLHALVEKMQRQLDWENAVIYTLLAGLIIVFAFYVANTNTAHYFKIQHRQMDTITEKVNKSLHSFEVRNVNDFNSTIGEILQRQAEISDEMSLMILKLEIVEYKLSQIPLDVVLEAFK